MKRIVSLRSARPFDSGSHTRVTEPPAKLFENDGGGRGSLPHECVTTYLLPLFQAIQLIFM